MQNGHPVCKSNDKWSRKHSFANQIPLISHYRGDRLFAAFSAAAAPSERAAAARRTRRTTSWRSTSGGRRATPAGSRTDTPSTSGMPGESGKFKLSYGSLEESCWHEPDTILKFAAEYLISNSHPHCEIQLWPPESRQHAARYHACMHLNKFPHTSLEGSDLKFPNILSAIILILLK